MHGVASGRRWWWDGNKQSHNDHFPIWARERAVTVGWSIIIWLERLCSSLSAWVQLVYFLLSFNRFYSSSYVATPSFNRKSSGMMVEYSIRNDGMPVEPFHVEWKGISKMSGIPHPKTYSMRNAGRGKGFLTNNVNLTGHTFRISLGSYFYRHHIYTTRNEDLGNSSTSNIKDQFAILKWLTLIFLLTASFYGYWHFQVVWCTSTGWTYWISVSDGIYCMSDNFIRKQLL